MKLFNKINENYKSLLKKLKIDKLFPNNFVLFILIIYTITFFSFGLINNTTTVKSFDENKFSPTQVSETKIYSLNTKNIKKIDIISIKVGTYNKKINSRYKFSFYKNDKVISSKSIITSKLNDNEYLKFKLSISCKNGDNYYVKIIPKEVDENNIMGVFTNEDNEIFSKYEVKSNNMLFCCIIFLISLIAFFIINYLINCKKISLEKILLAFSLYFLILSFLIPPFHAPDEFYHFSQSYGLTNSFYSDEVITFPSNYKCLLYGNESNNVKDVSDITKCISSKKSTKSMYFDSRLQSYNIAHILLSVPIKITRIFTSSPVIVFYIGRIMNLVLNLLILYLALKIIPFGKKNMFLIVTIPVFIQQFITYSYDGLVNSVSVLLVAYILNLIYVKEKISIKNFLIYMLLVFLILNLKMPYVILGGLFFLVPKSKFNNSNIKKYGIIILVLIASFVLYKLFNNLIGSNNSGTNGLVTNSLTSLIRNPINTIKLFAKTILINSKFYITSMIGGFDWLNLYLDHFYIKTIICMFIILLFSGDNKLDRKSKLFDLAINIIIFLGILLALYISWTGTGSSVIEGVQGRYFLPLLLPFSFVFMAKKEYIHISDEFIGIFSNMIIMSYVFTLLIAYY